jgi:outer membrane protein OmpA-like peptidoglycan-associated protein
MNMRITAAAPLRGSRCRDPRRGAGGGTRLRNKANRAQAASAGWIAGGVSVAVLTLSACGLTVSGQPSAASVRLSEPATAQSVLVVLVDPASPSALSAADELIGETARPRERLVLLDPRGGTLLAATTAPASPSVSVPGPPRRLSAGSTSFQQAQYRRAARQYNSTLRRARVVLRQRQRSLLASWVRSATGHLPTGIVRGGHTRLNVRTALATAATDFSSLHEAGVNANSRSVLAIMTPPGATTGAVPTLSPQLRGITIVVNNFAGASADQASWQDGLVQAGARRVVLLTPATHNQLLPIVREGLDGAITDTLTSVLFASGMYQIQPGAVPQLDRLLHLLTVTYPAATVSINGYTDSVPAHAAGGNTELSRLRALAVQAWLVAHRVAATRMQVSGYGDGDPVAPNTPSGQPLNRRVVVVIDPAAGN